MDMPTAIGKVLDQQNLNSDEMLEVMDLIMTGAATDAQIGGFLVGLRAKGETVDEITAAATVMRRLATPVEVKVGSVVDTCGTGGSGSNKFNVSTASAFVASAAGVAIAKHGNRAASSKSGSADVLEALGAEIMLTPEQVGRCVDTVGVGFLFALNHHSAMKHAIGPRKEMIVRTVFNLLGPLTNPAGAKRQVLGVYDKAWVRPVGEVLQKLGSEHVLVVHSADGLDEISIAGETFAAELKDNQITEFVITPESLGLTPASLDDLVVEDAAQSANIVQAALDGSHETATDIVCLNAGAAIYVAGLCADLKAGVAMAQDAVGSGLAKAKLKDFCDFTQNLKAMA
jgi:anthranilate phosphoribosyltransferase